MTVTIKAKALEAFVADIFASAGCSTEEGGRIGRYLVSANLTGHDSHGVVRVPRYAAQKKNGTVVADVTVEVVVDTPVIAVIDGKYGFGQTVTPQAVRIGIDKCRKNGLVGRDAAQRRPCRPRRRLGRDGGGRGPGLDPFRQRLGQRAGRAVRRRRPALLDRAVTASAFRGPARIRWCSISPPRSSPKARCWSRARAARRSPRAR